MRSPDRWIEQPAEKRIALLATCWCDTAAAVAAFHWPNVGDRFNWALDWFDPVAAANPRTALRIIGEDGSDRSYSFAEMSERSDRLATSLAAEGVATGDRVMVMLG